MDWTLFSAGKNQDDITLHQEFLQGGQTFTHEYSFNFNSTVKEDSQMKKYLDMYGLDEDNFSILLCKKIYATLSSMGLLYEKMSRRDTEGQIIILENFNEGKHITVTVYIHAGYLKIVLVNFNYTYDTTPLAKALDSIINKILSIIESIQTLEKLFLTNSKYYENHNILLDSFDRNPDPRDNGASMLNNVLLFSLYNEHKDILSKQQKFLFGNDPDTQPLTGKRLKQLLESFLMNPELGF